MNIKSTPVITLNSCEYETIKNFSWLLNRLCRLSDSCERCQLCFAIDRCEDKSCVIDKILERLTEMNALDVIPLKGSD